MDKVSIIIPVYNSEKFLGQAIESVINQTYTNWEALIVNDCSTDDSELIILDYMKRDSRIKYYNLSHNSGAAIARNEGLYKSTGKYIAYLDADDLWLPDKLEKQTQFMKNNNVVFSCCDYEKIDENGQSLNKIIHMPKTITYKQLLGNTIIQTVGVIIDADQVNKELLVMPNVRRGQDSATWLKLLKNGITFVGQNEVLAKYRRVTGSLSSNKFKAIKRTWKIYREIEKLSLIQATTCLLKWAFNACKKRIYLRGNK